MTVMFADSFDTYASAADMLNNGKWTGTSFPSIASAASTRFNYGQSMQLAATNHNVNKDGLPNSSNTIVFVVTVFGAPNAMAVVFRESGASQCSIVWEANGNITVRSGTFTGTTIATFAAGLLPNSWHNFQVKVIISNTVGEVHIRQDGQTTDTYVATALNTRAGTANAYINGFMLTEVSGTGYFDDIMLIDCAGTIPNDFPGDIRCYMLYPNGAGSSTNFGSANTVTYNTTASPQAVAANTLTWSGPLNFGGRPGTVNAFSISLSAGFTGNVTGYIYADVSNAPNGLLGTSTQVTNPATGVVTFNFSTPVTIAAGASYHFAVASDTAFNVLTNGGSGANWNKTTTGVTYPGTIPGVPTGAVAGPQFFLSVVWTCANWSLVNEALWDGDTSIVYDSNIGDQDIYAMSDLPSTPAFVTALQVRMIARKSDTGFRAVQTVFASGATTVTGTSTALATTYAEFDQIFGADPNTSAAWTAAAVNALQAGVKVSG